MAREIIQTQTQSLARELLAELEHLFVAPFSPHLASGALFIARLPTPRVLDPHVRGHHWFLRLPRGWLLVGQQPHQDCLTLILSEI